MVLVVIINIFLIAEVIPAQTSDIISIKNELNRWMKGYNQKNLENSVAVFSEDYIGYYAGHPDQSRKSLREQNEEVFNNKYLKATLSMEAVEIESSGDLAYVTIKQKWAFKPTNAGNPQIALEKGILIMKKQSDGGWKIIRSSTFPVSSQK